MKILLVTNVYDTEIVGPARFAKLLHKAIDINVEILTYDGVNGEGIHHVDLNLPFWKRKLTQYYSVSILQEKLKKIVSGFDFVLFNNATLAYGVDINIPYAVMVNDEKSIAPHFTFSFNYFRRRLLRKMEKTAVEKSKAVIVNSNYLKQSLLKSYKHKSELVHVLYKGISLQNKQKQYPYKSLTGKKCIEVLFVKNDYRIGGLEDLVEALEILDNLEFNLKIIGPDKGKLTNLKKPSNIHFEIMGSQSNDTVIDAMYGADILCIPALHEPLGVAVMEGLAVGIPVVTTGVGGLPEVTNNGAYVWECQPNSKVSIANTIRECINREEKRREKSLEGRAFIHSNFSIDNTVSRLLDIIRSV